MAEITTLIPPIDANVAEENIAFDFGLVLDPTVTLQGVLAINVTVIAGSDPTPQMRLLGSPQIIASPTTGALASAVVQRFGQTLDGVIYGLQCVAQTSDNQKPTCDAQIESRRPFP